jgi:foldase protein PrsA
LADKNEALEKDQSKAEADKPAADKSEVKPKPKATSKSTEEGSKKTEKVEKTDSSKDTASSATESSTEEARPGVRVASSSAAERAKALAGGVSMKSLRGTLIKVGAVVVILLVVIIAAFGVLIYAYKSESPAVRAAASVIPYPVEQVNGRFVSYSDYLFEVDANQKAYQNNAKLNNQPAVNFKSAEGKKLQTQIKQHALEKLKSDAVMAQLASEKKVKVTDKQVNDLINQLYERYGGKDTLLKTLNQIYGWNLNDLKGVIRKQLLAKNLEDKVTSDPAVDSAAKSKAEDVLKQVKAGTDFGELAKKYSQASDAASGGDLGFFTKGQLPDNVQAAAEALQPGQVSDVIKTQYGYEILKVLEKKDDGSIHGQHILIKTVDFNDYFQKELDKAKVKTYIKV